MGTFAYFAYFQDSVAVESKDFCAVMSHASEMGQEL